MWAFLSLSVIIRPDDYVLDDTVITGGWMDEQVLWCWPNLFPQAQKATFVVLREETTPPLIKQIKRKTVYILWEVLTVIKQTSTPMQIQNTDKNQTTVGSS